MWFKSPSEIFFTFGEHASVGTEKEKSLFNIKVALNLDGKLFLSRFVPRC